MTLGAESHTRLWLTAVVVGLALVWLLQSKPSVPQQYPSGILWREASSRRVPEYPRSSIMAGREGLAVAKA